MLNFEILEQKMLEKGLSYRRISQLMGFTSSGTVWKWLHSRNQIRAQHIEKLAEILEISIQDFFIQSNDSQPGYTGGECE